MAHDIGLKSNAHVKFNEDSLQSALRRPEVHTFAWKIGIYTTYIRATHVRTACLALIN